MKAAEVLQRYANGERNFRGANLRGQNFRGQDLSGADFRGADIRGASFTFSILKNTQFQYARGGLGSYSTLYLIIVAALLSVLSGFCSALLSAQIHSVLAQKVDRQFFGLFALSLLMTHLLVSIYQGTVRASLAVMVHSLISIAVAVMITDLDTVSSSGPVSGTIFLMVVIGLGYPLSLAIVDNVASLKATGGLVFFVGVSSGIFLALEWLPNWELSFNTILSAVLITLLVTSVNIYICQRAFQDDARDVWVKSIVVTVTAIGSTSFRGTDLTNADFFQAQLKSADFRKAILTRTNWKDATKLDRIRPGDNYLNNPKIQTLLTTGNGKDQDFDGLLNLIGLNLVGANLENASFLGSTLKDATLQGANLTGANLILANLNHANLQGADLTNAKLVQTQLDHADLTGATLTGAIIEEWGITTATILDGIHCNYVFMRLPPAGARTDINPHRKPDDWNKTFAEGEFVEFITPMMETLDLYHNQTVDPRAMALAFNDLRQQHPDADLDIVSMEKRGKNRDKFLIRAEANPGADLSELHSQYFERYDYLRTLPAEALQALLIEKENNVKMLVGLISTAITKPTTQIETYQNQGDTVMGNKESTNETNLEIGSMAGAINTGGGHATASEFTQNVTNIESKQTLAEAAAEIQALLKQLETSYPADSATAKMVMATEAVKQIEANPTFKQKAVAALVAGGTKALEAAIDHPAAAFVVGAIEEWKGR